MRNECFFKVAGLPFSVNFSKDWNIEELLPSFRPFRCEEDTAGQPVFRLSVVTRPFADKRKPAKLLSESSNDMGHVRLSYNQEGYQTEIDYGDPDKGVHVMTTDCLFEHGTACLCPETPTAGTALSSMLRILFAQAVLDRGGISLHASCVSMDGKSYLFLGKSGTGKSTHARQWITAFPGCRLLNDDNPVLRIEEGGTMAYGTPWSGKTPCYQNESYPVAGIVRLQQSGTNRFTPLAGPEAFVALLPSCSAIHQDSRLQDALCHTLIRIAEQTPVGQMECLPDREAAWLCFKGIGV